MLTTRDQMQDLSKWSPYSSTIGDQIRAQEPKPAPISQWDSSSSGERFRDQPMYAEDNYSEDGI